MMYPVKLGTGDNTEAEPISRNLELQVKSDEDEVIFPVSEIRKQEEDSSANTVEVKQSEVTAQVIDDNEAKLKDRIAQCRNIIESLKIELNEEKSKLEKQSKSAQQRSTETSIKPTRSHYVSTSNSFLEELSYSSGMYSDCVDSKLNCDENLMEYEKQLQKYQNTLNMAQIEKKNVIRKQMLAKAYKLKLLEVENQCNIELLRVKQSLQCLEPLQLIASKWKTGTDDSVDGNSYELMPRNPDLSAHSSCDIKKELDMKAPLEIGVHKEDCVSPD